MFAALLIESLVRANLSEVPVLAVGGTLLVALLLMAALCLALRPLLARHLGADGRNVLPQACRDAGDRDRHRPRLRIVRDEPGGGRLLRGRAGVLQLLCAARQMGGDAPLMAQILTFQTAFAAVTMPIVIGLL